MTEGTKLPSPNPFNPTVLLMEHSAYQICLDMEARTEIQSILKTGHLTPLVCARFLGYMVLEAPTDAGRLEISTEIVHCTDDTFLQTLANLYKDHFIRCFQVFKDPTLSSSDDTSTSSNDFQDISHGQLFEMPQNRKEAKARALKRDGYQCMLTGKVDREVVLKNIVELKEDVEAAYTCATHVFDTSMNQYLDGDKKHEYAMSIHALCTRYGQIDTTEELNGAAIHRLENILTLCGEIHERFDKLYMWLERKTDDPVHCYRPAAIRPFLLRGVLTEVHFQSPDPKLLPLPDPRYLALHAACARVAHFSGVSEYFRKVSDDMKQVDVLAAGGDSVEALYHAIMRRPDIA